MRSLRWMVVILGVSVSCQGPQPSRKALQIVAGEHRSTLELTQLGNMAQPVPVEVQDYYFKRTMKYRAFPMAQLLRAIEPKDRVYDEILFRCADGYLARALRSSLDQGKLDSFFLAFGEGNADKFTSLLQQGKANISPGPFYAVSTDPAGYSTLTWPYQVVAIEFVNFQKEFPNLLFEGLKDNARAFEGFHIFRFECLRCHSINLQGGEIGPELNTPQNITEYRNTEYLKKFIRQPSAYRARSKMPDFPELKEKDLEALIAYLVAMRDHKKN